MAIFFFTVGLEVRREFAIGELTSWSRALVPVMAAIAGLVVPAALFLLIARGTGQEHAWGVVISTDTAFLVGALALVGPRVSGRLRVFLLALAVVDDIGALSIIALFYTADFNPMPLIVAAVGLTAIYFTRYLRRGRGPVYGALAIIVWLAFLASGVHPTLAGVAIALLVPVYRPNRRDVEQALELARTFRQSPNSEYARLAANSLRESISINERLTSAYAPYVAYVILPIFALANAGVQLSPEILLGAVRSPLTWAIVVGLVVGKFVGVFGSALLLKVFRFGEFGPGLTLDRIAGGAALCGIGFTISLFIIDLAISDPAAANEARVGVLAASVLAFVLACRDLPGLGFPASRRRWGTHALAADRPPARPLLRRPRRAPHDRRVRRLPVPVLPQGVGFDRGGAARAGRSTAVRVEARASRSRASQRPRRGRGG